MIWACASLALQQPALLPEALAVTGAGKTKPDDKPRLATLDEINKIYEDGHPSNDLSGHNAAGVVIHMHDLTEQNKFLPGESAQWQGPDGFWASSIINRQMPGFYMPPTGGGPCDGSGVIVNPRTARVLCSAPYDFTSWTAGCTGLCAADDDKCTSKLFRPESLEAMLNVSSGLQSRPNVQQFGGKYNEVLISSQDYREQLPEAVAAVFFTSDESKKCADDTHRAIVGAFGIERGQVLLLNHTPGGSPGFALYESPERPEDLICTKPAGWCSHYSAQNEPKECGGQPGHFCHDSFGKSGFSPCDAKLNATWGAFECKGDESAPAAADDGKRGERSGAATAAWWAAGKRLPGSRDGDGAAAAAAAPPPSGESETASRGTVSRLNLAQQRHQHRWSHLLALLVGSPSASQLVWNSSVTEPSSSTLGSASPHNGSSSSSSSGSGSGGSSGGSLSKSLWRAWGTNITSLFGSGGSPINKDRRAAGQP
jgi:hypothetical protein